MAGLCLNAPGTYLAASPPRVQVLRCLWYETVTGLRQGVVGDEFSLRARFCKDLQLFLQWGGTRCHLAEPFLAVSLSFTQSFSAYTSLVGQEGGRQKGHQYTFPRASTVRKSQALLPYLGTSAGFSDTGFSRNNNELAQLKILCRGGVRKALKTQTSNNVSPCEQIVGGSRRGRHTVQLWATPACYHAFRAKDL